jgi:hypothetical protein
MVFKANFTSLMRDSDTIRVLGKSEEAADVIEIRVVLAQGEKLERGILDQVDESWVVEIPADGFEAGPAFVFGVETRRTNLTTVTWAESLTIPEA